MQFILKIRKKIRWKMAELLDNFKETCWASLVLWATNPNGHEFLEIWPWRAWHKETVWEHSCTEKYGAYCGKCYQTGRLEIPAREKEIFKKLEDEYWNFPFDISNQEVIIQFKEDDK